MFALVSDVFSEVGSVDAEYVFDYSKRESDLEVCERGEGEGRKREERTGARMLAGREHEVEEREGREGKHKDAY